jgi:hypothetical protein
MANLCIAISEGRQAQVMRFGTHWVKDQAGKITRLTVDDLPMGLVWRRLQKATIAAARADLLDRPRRHSFSRDVLDSAQLAEDGLDSMIVAGGSASDPLTGVLDHERAQAWLNLLSPKERTMASLLTKHPKPRVAALLGVAPSTLDVMLHRARRKIAKDRR